MRAAFSPPKDRDDALPESIKKLKSLKESIAKELDHERRLRQDEENRDTVIPLSLVGPDGQPVPGTTVARSAASSSPYGNPNTSGGGPLTVSSVNGKSKGGIGGAVVPAGRTAGSAKGSSPNGQPSNQGSNGTAGANAPGAPAAVREKLASLKLDKHTQRDIEAELEKRSADTMALKAQNARLRDIIALRQSCCERREAELNAEVQRLEQMCDTLCVDANDMDGTMERLREMNAQIQEGASRLKAVIEDQAESDRLQLIRTYRVRMREVRQQVVDQDKRNLEGASVWIQRHSVLTSDVTNAEQGLQSLRVTIEQLQSHNEELALMQAHQRRQRDHLTNRVAVVKRENTMLEKHIKELEAEVVGVMRSSAAAAVASNYSDGPEGNRGGTSPDGDVPSRGASRRAARKRALSELPGAGGPPDSMDKKQEAALADLRKALEDMRRSLKQVRAAHVELLQERTELQIFLRQSIEDVRREMFRHTIVSNMGETQHGDHAARLLQDYGASERKKLMDVLQSKLRVYSSLYAAMFPQKPLSLEELHNLDGAQQQVYGSEGIDRPSSALGQLRPEEERLLNAALTGESGARLNSVVGSDGKLRPVVSDTSAVSIDELWGTWKKWTTPSSSGAPVAGSGVANLRK